MTTDRSPGAWSLAVRQQEVVARVSQLGLRSTDLEAVLREAMAVTADTLGLAHVVLFEVAADGEDLVGRAGFVGGNVVGSRPMVAVRLPQGPASLPGFAVVAQEPVVVPDLLGDDRFRALVPDDQVAHRSAIAAPIGWDGRPFGVLVVYDEVIRSWTDDEVHFVQAIANTVGLTIARAGIERELRYSNIRLDLSLAAGGLGTWSWDPTDGSVTLHPVALMMHGQVPERFGGHVEHLLATIHPDDRARVRTEARAALDRGADHHHCYRVVRPDDGEQRWIETWGRSLPLLVDAGGPTPLIVGICVDITDRRRAEQVQEALLQREHEARVEAETARERLAFLSEATALLAASLDPEATLQHLADLCVPILGQVCFIDVVDDDGDLVDHAARAVSHEVLQLVRALRERRVAQGSDAPPGTGGNLVVGTNGLLVPAITDAQLAAAASDDEHLALLRRFGPRSTIVAPLVARGRAAGLLTLVRTGDATPYDHEDLAFVEELAARAALAVDNGRLFRSRSRVARSLQAALLPPALPSIEGLALAARYDVAEPDVAIGGDFYDVISLGTSAWGVVVGDVCGRGPDAAALTGLVRHTVRSSVVHAEAPSDVLAMTNAAVLVQIDEARFCTAAYLRVEVGDAAAGRVRVVGASAGHPRPVLVRADGHVALLRCAGTLLGVVDDPILVDVEVELLPGDAVVLYTDGVTEARRGPDLFGEARLLEVLASLAGGHAEEIAAGLERAVTAYRDHAKDDMAILVVQSSASTMMHP